MSQDLGIFGPIHFAILAAIPLTAAGLTWWNRWRPENAKATRLLLATLLCGNEIATWVLRYQHGWARFPDVLPLQLSDLTLWLTIYLLVTGSRAIFDIAYYLGLVGAGLTCVTPELFAPVWTLPSIQFFVAHGGVIVSLLYLLWTHQARPRPGSRWKALAAALGWAAFVGTFNVVFHTNYMFLCHKPAGTTLIDLFGPWPVYLLVTLVVAVALFWLLWLPYRHAGIDEFPTVAGSLPGPDRT